ncbi:ATP-binding protein [Pseudoxanthomonas sacheonensis]|uniref:ATP-binding protein n=1 Tax=Pseudoxanthomonas sacheonensis TaxID=443615 RepID=UPI0013CF80C5|nr:ATP-binding protein [Pseudoxanthomonas sacheonensis]KAF1710756.1 histidine kinase [Pseudoxanthomonas sacheonensis]
MYPQLFEAVPDALVLVDDQGLIVQTNSRASSLFGYPENELVGVSIEMLVPEGARARHRAHRAGYMAHPHVRAMGATGQTLMGRRYDGTQFPLEIALSPINSDGTVQYLASIRDISDSPRARQVLVRAGYDALVARFGQLALESKEDEDVLAHVPLLLAESLGIESVLIAFVSADNDRVEIRASTGLDGQAYADGIHIDQQMLLATLRKGRAWMVEDFSLAGTREQAFPLSQLASGSAALVPLLDVNRPMGALLAFSRQPRKFDHDALHLLQSFANLIAALVQRQRTQDQLAHVQRLDALGQLTGGIAHDFNNLLTIMSGNLQLLESEYDGTSEARELIDSALRSVTRGAELTAKLLSFARRQRLVPQAVDLKAMLHDLNQMLRRTLGDTIRLRTVCPDGLPSAHADPAQLDTALVNLALNARDAMPRGGEIAIEVSRMTDSNGTPADLPIGDYLLITVSDTGRGMSQATLDHAMEPFFTTKEAGRGSGLGLSMVHGFSKQSGGDLWIDSALGYGTHVHLCLPVDRGGGTLKSAQPAANPHGTGETILVVEDEDSVRRIAVAFLRKAGYRVTEAASADAALRELDADDRIALLFTDVLLGEGGNGKELANAALRLRPGLPVLLTSGFEQKPSPSPHAEIESVSFDLLRKPYRREQLLDAVRQSLLQDGV